MTTRIQEILRKSIPLASVLSDGKYTVPRSWGVYEIQQLPDVSLITRRFRFGNHPIRQQELATEFASVELIAIFRDRTIANELAQLLNSEPDGSRT